MVWRQLQEVTTGLRLPSRADLAVGAIGLTATVGQLILLRELASVLYGNELVFSLILAAWLACGALGARWKIGGLERSVLPLLQRGNLAAVVLLLAEIVLLRAGRGLLGGMPGLILPLGDMAALIVAGLGPLSVLLGRQFALGARLLGSRAYAAESLGAVAGGAMYSLLLVQWLTPFQIAMSVGMCSLAIGGIEDWKAGARAHSGRVLLMILLLLVLLPLGAWLHWATLRWQYPGLRYARDSAYGRIVVTAGGEQRVFYENGLLLFETQGAGAEEMGHLPLLAHPDPRRVLLIGGGVRGTLAEMLHHPSVESIDYVELDPALVAAARAELPAEQSAALDDGRVRLLHEDGRATVARLGRDQAGGASFDVIALDLPEPSTGQINRFYTREFFAAARRVLAPGGVLALSVPWAENYAGPAEQRLAGSVYRALAAEMPDVALLPGQRLLMLASAQPLPAEPAVWRARLAQRGLDTRWVVPSTLDYSLTTDRVAQAQRLLAATPARENRDLAPASYFYGQTAWLSRLHAGLGRLDARPAQLAWLAVPLAAAVIAARVRRGSGAAVSLAVGLIGLAEMAIQGVLLLSFQEMHGTVYGRVGLIVTAFMAGLALGSTAAGRLRDRTTWPRVPLVWIQGGLAVFSAALAALVYVALPVWAFVLLAGAAGTLGGAAFPVAVGCLAAGRERVAGWAAASLYGADLVGACLGALLVSTLLVPVLGLPATCLVAAGAAAAGVIALL